MCGNAGAQYLARTLENYRVNIYFFIIPNILIILCRLWNIYTFVTINSTKRRRNSSKNSGKSISNSKYFTSEFFFLFALVNCSNNNIEFFISSFSVKKTCHITGVAKILERMLLHVLSVKIDSAKFGIYIERAFYLND